MLEYLNSRAGESELIVVDDGSSDETANVAEESLRDAGSVAARVITVRPNRGKGHAVRTGLLAARAPIALFSDADLSTPITETPKLVEPIERGEYDLTFGSRALDRTLIGVHQPWRREQGGRIINLIVGSQRVCRSGIAMRLQGFSYERLSPAGRGRDHRALRLRCRIPEVAHLAGLRLKEIAVRWDHNDGSKLSVWRDTPRLIGEVRTVRRQARRGVYDQAIAAVQAQFQRAIIRGDGRHRRCCLK